MAISRTDLVLAVLVVCVIHVGANVAARADPPECRELAQSYHAGEQTLAHQQVMRHLARAAREGCRALAEQLLNDGASLAARGREGETALHHAMKAAEPDVAALLIDRGASIEQRKLDGATPLTLAIESNRLRTVVLLLDRGADPSAAGRGGVSPMTAAAYGGHDEIVRLLLSKGADSNAADATGKTAIVYAAARGHATIVEQLLAAGVDANARSSNELTTLMWAAGHASDVPDQQGLKTAEFLLARGARLDEVDNRGRSALMIAAELGHAEMVAFLLERRASAGLKDLTGKTALDLAANETVRRRLIDHADDSR